MKFVTKPISVWYRIHIETYGAIVSCMGSLVLKSFQPATRPHTDQDTRSCVSGQESRVTHKCVIYRIKTHGRVSAAKKAV